MEKLPEKKLRQERKYEKSFGLDVKIKAFYFRHAEKASGKVGDSSGVSKSFISEKGQQDSEILGALLPEPAEHGHKMAWSSLERTSETGDAMLRGYSPDNRAKEFKKRVKIELLGKSVTKEFLDLYISKCIKNDNEILKAKGLDPDDYPKLTPEEQAEISEKGEENVIEGWINNEDSELVKMLTPEQAAADLAVIVRRDINMPKKLKLGSRIDLFRMTHKTITEPLLMKIIILPDGGKPDKLKDIGGSMGLNEGWEINSFINENGEKEVKLFLYRVDKSEDFPKYNKEEYKIDLDELNRLADLGIKTDEGTVKIIGKAE